MSSKSVRQPHGIWVGSAETSYPLHRWGPARGAEMLLERSAVDFFGDLRL